jgi:hypothetical protein
VAERIPDWKAAGFTSRSQQYRARKAGYDASAGGTYRTAVDAAAMKRRGDALTKRQLNGKLLGLASLRKGVAAAAAGDTRGLNALGAEISRWGNSRHVRMVIELSDGSVVRIGDRGGWRVGLLKAARADAGSWPAAFNKIVSEYLAKAYEGNTAKAFDAGELDIELVTVEVA